MLGNGSVKALVRGRARDRAGNVRAFLQAVVESRDQQTRCRGRV